MRITSEKIWRLAANLRLFSAMLVCVALLTACGGSGNSFMEEFELPTFGGDSDESELEMPPGLVKPQESDRYVIPGSKASMQAAMMSSYVLPQRLDMQVAREGNTVWLSVGVEPIRLWPYLRSFLEGYGFTVARENPTYGMIETDWLERDLNDDEVFGVRMRDKFRIRIEREANAITNVYITNRKFFYQNRTWQVSVSDVETETDLLYDLGDYLRGLQESGSETLPELEEAELLLEVVNLKGVPVLKIGRGYSKAWRALAVAIDRAGIDVRHADRSRGIFLIDYDDGETGRTRSMELHLLEKRGNTLVTLHSDRDGTRPLSYTLAYDVLRRIVWAYA